MSFTLNFYFQFTEYDLEFKHFFWVAYKLATVDSWISKNSTTFQNVTASKWSVNETYANAVYQIRISSPIQLIYKRLVEGPSDYKWQHQRCCQ